MVKYNPYDIHSVVQQLYFWANFVIVFYGLLGLIFGIFVGYGFIMIAGARDNIFEIGAIIGSIIGIEIGISKAITYKFKAQMLLTQVKIEKNTYTLSEISSITSNIIDVVENIADK